MNKFRQAVVLAITLAALAVGLGALVASKMEKKQKTRYVIFSAAVGQMVTCDNYRVYSCGVSISGCDSDVEYDCLQSVAKIKIKQGQE